MQRNNTAISILYTFPFHFFYPKPYPVQINTIVERTNPKEGEKNTKTKQLATFF